MGFFAVSQSSQSSHVAAPAVVDLPSHASAANATHRAHAYRPDIDGMRALAICAVLVFHAFPAALPGGFAGVDIFFVISGFLITRALAHEHAAGRVRLGRFYARRVRRIFPALALMLAGVYALGWYLLDAAEYKQLGRHLRAGAGFVSNWVAWNEAGYFDSAADTKPLLHLWSLAVEEQFYLVWPLLLGLAMRMHGRSVVACAVVLALSFAANIWIVGEHASAAFFLPFTRFWEPLAGAMLALAPTARPAPGRQADLLSLAGLGLCLLSCAVLRPEFAFPGWWAALPVLGACALIGAGPQAMVNRSLLAHPLALWIGAISYPLYLWHWPLLSFTTIVAGAQPVPAWVRLALLGASVLLAWLTTTLLEPRFRTGPPRLAKVVVPCLALLAVGAAGHRVDERNGHPSRKGYDAHADVATASVGKGRAFVHNACGIPDARLVSYCASDVRATPGYAVWGDSKADALYWGLVRRSAPMQSWTLVGRASCTPLSGVERTSPYRGDVPADCAAANRLILPALLANRSLHTVVLAFSDRDTLGPQFAWSAPDTQPRRDTSQETLVLAGLDRAVTALEQAGKRVAVVLDNPRLPEPARCMERAVFGWPGVRRALALGPGPAAARCDLPYGAYLAQRQGLANLVARLQERHPGMVVFDPAAALCDLGRQVCPMTVNGRYLYSYGDHVSDTGNGRMADALLPLLAAQARAHD
jgi:peptidoglycan/LPS O-acetylase OafA/YrhL